jgi:dTDP-4-amino-4,6-dideoxygalactose transaminase
MNSALAFVQLKELDRNEAVRREMSTVYTRSLLQSRHKTLIQNGENAVPAVYSFPVLLASGFKDVKQYAARKEIEIVPAFTDSVIALREPELEFCINAKSLLLRCALFPLYPRLGNAQAVKVAKVLATLP